MRINEKGQDFQSYKYLKFNRVIMFIFVIGSLEGFGKTNS